jgi:dolichol-phosphate mannosyltransferase
MIFVLVPVYNEAENLINLHRELDGLKIDEPLHFIFSDDGSTDHSRQVIEKLFVGKNFIVLGDGVNRGPGAAFNTGFEWVLKNGKPQDTVLTMEADCTSDLSILPIMLTLHRLGYDLVLASVYAQGGGFEQTSFLRKFLSAAANFTFRFLFDVKVLTLSSFYRIYSVSLLKNIQEQFDTIIIEQGFVCSLEILVKAIRCQAQIIEVPMQLHSSKRIGKSKMKVYRTMFAYFKFLLRGKLMGLR